MSETIEKTNLAGIKHLLENVNSIQKKYDEIAEITGEKFNIFGVLNLTSNEVRTHSAFIGELLNTRGSHGLKDIPLKLFIKMLEEKFTSNEVDEAGNKIDSNRFEINTETSKTIVEKHIGKLNCDKTDGGRIDIIIEDNKKKALIIENKIYAGEQENQLIRYYNYSKENFIKEAPILYLTLDGSSSNSGKGLNEKEHYFNISYKEDIINWLELCIKEASDKPMLREVIKQYIYLIKKLTGQTINKKMSEEVQNIILNNYSAAEQITKEFEKVKYKILGRIRTKLFDKFVTELGSKYNVIKAKEKVGEKNSGIWLELKGYEKAGIFFGIEPFNGKGNVRDELFFGILDLGNNHNNIFQKHNFKCNGWWRDVCLFDNLENLKNNLINFNDSELISYLARNKEKQDELVETIAKQMIDFIKLKEDSLIRI